jgi:hypothetical protein
MLGSIIASKTARLITACVCPVVGAGTLTMSVPKVRNAVHRATAPSEYALPKTRERLAEPISAPAPCSVIGATPLSAGYIEDVPTSLYPFPGSPDVSGVPILSTRYRGPGTKEPILSDLPPGGGVPPGGVVPPGGGAPPPGGGAVPEPHTWLQLVAGFTLVGGAVRMARKRPTEEEEALLERVEQLKRKV